MSSNDPLNQIAALSCPSRENQARGKQSKPRGAPTVAKSNLATKFLFPITQKPTRYGRQTASLTARQVRYTPHQGHLRT
ncbi:hypothetical protein [Flagellimonas sp. S3867]|uniref:hypothetical protein n=1 Tax=Flagellimonas sp. S3867 TaxID=2768063 RepID=UPI0016862D72|nr:hypothetical protein [Flagellimonas sp. S3867]